MVLLVYWNFWNPFELLFEHWISASAWAHSPQCIHSLSSLQNKCRFKDAVLKLRSDCMYLTNEYIISLHWVMQFLHMEFFPVWVFSPLKFQTCEDASTVCESSSSSLQNQKTSLVFTHWNSPLISHVLRRDYWLSYISLFSGVYQSFLRSVPIALYCSMYMHHTCFVYQVWTHLKMPFLPLDAYLYVISI